MKDRRWIPWAVCIAFYTAGFLLAWKNSTLLLLLSMIPFLAVSFVRVPLHRKMVEYLHSNYPEKWGEMARDMHTKMRGSFAFLKFLFSEEETDDLELARIKNVNKRAAQLHIFTGAVLILVLMFS